MGCDIHLAVEVRNGDGKWHRALPPEEIYDSWLAKQAAKETGDSHYYRDRVKVEWFNDRNYNLFAILAGVRNGYDFVPISEPRGLPSDLSPEVKKLDYMSREESESGGGDNDISLGDHSQSWLTLAELLACDWTQEVKEGGWVNPQNFLLWQKEGRPHEWSGGIAGGGIEHQSWREMKSYIENGYIVFSDDGQTYTGRFDGIAGARSYYAYVEWPISYQTAAGRFYEHVIPALQKLGAPEDVRIVFGFDN